MKVLVVGGAGYVGDALTDLLLDNCHEVTVYDNLLYEDRYLKRVSFIFGDCRDTAKLLQEAVYHDVVVWLSALVGDPCCANNTSLAYEINVESVKNFVDKYTGKIVFPSTCSVYGANNDLLNEDSPTNPLSVYASTKLEAEQYILKKCPDALVLRLGTLFGVSGLFSRPRLDLVVNTLTMKACKDEDLHVFGGDQYRPLLHVKDVALAMYMGINKCVDGIYCLALKNYTIKAIAKKVVDYTGSYSKINYTDIPYIDSRNYRVSTEKADKWFSPVFSLEDGVYELESLFKENRVKDTDNPVYNNGKWTKRV